MATSSSQVLVEARDLVKTNPAKAEELYKQVLQHDIGKSESASRHFETALMGLGELYRDQKKPYELAELLKTSRSSFSSFAKAKSAKLGMNVSSRCIS